MMVSKTWICAALASTLIVSCGKGAPKTGVMPGVATGGYSAPTNAEASASYMGGFVGRYDIPELDYPDEIKLRIKNARRARLERDMEDGANRTEFMAKLALMVTAQKDPEAKRLWEDLKNRPETKPEPSDINNMMSLMETVQPSRPRLSKGQRQIKYSNAIRGYKSAYKSLVVNSCRWTEMTRLIGSGHEGMAFVHGIHPTHGFRCAVEIKVEVNKGYPRPINFNAFWVKSEAGDWQYYGKFPGVGMTPRLQFLDPNKLRDPERAIANKRAWDDLF